MIAPTQMNRFHVHIHVADLARNGSFSQLFGAAPSVHNDDYAKWMLDDPQLNFAISTRKASEIGIAHLGLQAGNTDALAVIGSRLIAADAITLTEAGTACCDAQSDKFWAEDPQGMRWETFHTHGEATTYHADPAGAPVERDSCCGRILQRRMGRHPTARPPAPCPQRCRSLPLRRRHVAADPARSFR